MGLLVFPGQRSQPAPLVDILREAHELARATRAAELEQRRKAGIPLDDNTAWPVVNGILGALDDAREKQDSATLARLAGDLARATTGNALVELPAFVPPEGIDGVVVVLQVISQADRLDLNAALGDAWAALLAAERADASMLTKRAADEAVLQAQLAIVRRVVVDVRGIEAPEGCDLWEGIRLAGLLPAFYSAARHFLTLPPGKALRCGLLSLST